MKYIRTALAEQETTVNILYNEQIIRIYSSRVEVIRILTKLLGEPTIKYKKSKTYWSGANWDVHFSDLKKIEKILLINSVIDPEIEIITPKKEKIKAMKKTTTKVNPEKAKTTKKATTKANLEKAKTTKKTTTKANTEKVKITKKVTTKANPKKTKATKKVTIKANNEKVKTEKPKVVKKVSSENSKVTEEFEQYSLI